MTVSDNADEAARRYVVHGRVQGVGFRYFVEQYAAELGLGGYVKNRFDGAVEVYAVGPQPSLRDLAKRLRSGPRFARVDRVEEEDAPLRDYRSFTIEY